MTHDTKISESKKLAALSSLALLKEDMDSQSRDYIDYLRAFVEHVISKHAVDPINSETVARALTGEFGLALPDRVVQLVLQRMLKAGSLAKQGALHAVVPGKLPRHEDFDHRRKNLGGQVEALLIALQAHLSRSGVQLTREDGLNALLRFLSRFAVNYLRAYLFKSALPEVESSADRIDVLLADFIKTCHNVDSELFGHVVALVKGQMYANALLCPDLEGIKKDFKVVRFFLDTPLALHLLGYHGAHHKKSAAELVHLLKSLGGKVSVFTHTQQEIAHVLRSAAGWVNHPNGRGQVVRCARLAGLNRSDLLVRADQVEGELRALGISLHLNPPFESTFQISELEFQGVLEDEIEYSNEMAMRADVESVRAIYSLRGKTVPSRLEDTLAVVITTNSGFARAAYEFGKSHNSTREVSPVVTDFSLANIAWLKSPMQWTNLPEVETLAACFAALEPSASDWRQYLAKLDELAERGSVDPDEHALLRVSPLSRSDILYLVSDVADPALAGGTVRDIVERIKGSLVADKEAELRVLRAERDELAAKESQQMQLLAGERSALHRLTTKIAATAVNVLIVAPLALLLALGLAGGSGLLGRFGFTVDNSPLLYLIALLAVAVGTVSVLVGTSFAPYRARAVTWLSQKLRAFASSSNEP